MTADGDLEQPLEEVAEDDGPARPRPQRRAPRQRRSASFIGRTPSPWWTDRSGTREPDRQQPRPEQELEPLELAERERPGVRASILRQLAAPLGNGHRRAPPERREGSDLLPGGLGRLRQPVEQRVADEPLILAERVGHRPGEATRREETGAGTDDHQVAGGEHQQEHHRAGEQRRARERRAPGTCAPRREKPAPVPRIAFRPPPARSGQTNAHTRVPAATSVRRWAEGTKVASAQERRYGQPGGREAREQRQECSQQQGLAGRRLRPGRPPGDTSRAAG